jgi:acyl dehydratase
MTTVPVDKLADFIDKPTEPTEWVLVDQDRINGFADVTMDQQFIHVDAEKAAHTPFGSTIAHGYLTMSLVSHFLGQCAVGPENAMMAINYGSDKVRFLQPVKVNRQVRGRATLLEVSDKAPGQLLTKTRMSIEIKGEETPAMVAEILTLFILS